MTQFVSCDRCGTSMDRTVKLSCEMRASRGSLLLYDRYRDLCPACDQAFRDLVDQFLGFKKGWQA